VQDDAAAGFTIEDRGQVSRGSGFHCRLGLWTLLILGWLVMLLYLWSAFATFPSAERLEQSRTMPIPSLRAAALLVARSALELGAALLLLWPWRARYYALRALAAAIGFGAWFIASTPLTISAMGWVHRRWLAAMILVLLLAFVAGAVARATAWLFTDRADTREG
jgi:hypothetical protein